MKITPLAGFALIEPIEAETKTASGIYLPDNAAEKPQFGKVAAVGKDKVVDDDVTITPEFKVGDKVLYKKWGGEDIKVENKEFKLVKFEDVMAIAS